MISLLLATSSCISGGKQDKGNHVESSEESGTQFGMNHTYDVVRNGVRMILSFDAESSFFIGSVKNNTNETIRKVRVEVHLSNGVELGPTSPGDLPSGEMRIIKLPAVGQEFSTWSAHAETGSGEHGHNGEESSEHDESGEEGDEHDKEGRSEHN